ncbi:MAG TPA: LysR family transcriptional regulator [Arsenicitalea sp.]|nr:LysR family transcriptional regulator [Arsenicitalea sp.]
MDITLKQLQIFQAVVIAGSITKASRRIGLSQPSISQQLAKLEEKLGSQLIQRNRTGVINLTPAGEYWFKAGDEMLRRLQSTVSEHRQRFVDNSVTIRMGVTPTLRGRFAAAAARIASEEPGFVKFDLKFAISSPELVEQLRLHQINFAIVNEEAIADDRGSFAVSSLFNDAMAWVVPGSVPLAEIKHALSRNGRQVTLSRPLRNFVDMDVNISMHSKSEEWYRHTLPEATPTFSATTYAMAVDIVAEGLATTHCPMSLLPNLPLSVREQLRIFPLDTLTRTMVLAMPKHLLTLPAYANVFRRITEFCRTDYNREMSPEGIFELPKAG